MGEKINYKILDSAFEQSLRNFCTDSEHQSLSSDSVEKEYKFHPTRKWRVDYAIPKIKLAIEIEGGVWTGGRHTRGKGYVKDIEKYNHLACAGYRLLRATYDQIISGEIDVWVKNYIDNYLKGFNDENN